jgi:tetratricopeptide (TPR) repeat protein
MTSVTATECSPTEFDGFVALAQSEQLAGRLAEAVSAYRKVLAVRPDLAEAHNNLANVLEQQGEFDAAVTHYKHALDLKPSLFRAHNNLARVFRRQGQLDQAATHFKRSLALSPDFAEVHKDLGNVLRTQGKLDEAVASFERALVINPKYSDAYNDLGNVLVDQGKLNEAGARFERAATLKPDFFQAHNNLGNILRTQGKLDQALSRFERAIALRPGYADAYNNLGNVLKDQGKLDEAVAQYERAAALKPEFFQALNNLANLLRSQGKLDQALERFEQVVAFRPDFVDAHCKLGDILKDQGKLDQAAARFQQAIALKPNHAEAHYNLGNVLRDQRKYDEAALQFERTLALRPNHAGAHNNLGTVLRNLGNTDDALKLFERAILLKPDYAEAYNNLGNVAREQGDLAQAAVHYERALALKPDIAEAHYNRADLKRFRSGDADLVALEALAAEAHRLSPSKVVHVHFALGKALDDTGDYQRAFEHLLQGNALKRREVKYNEAAHQEGFRLIAERFNSNLHARFRGVGDPSPVPIFVLGMPRSGSTLVEQILATHPLVHAGGELKNLDRAIRAVSDASSVPVPIPRCIVNPSGDDWRRLGQAYLESLPTPYGEEIRITDKMPKNFLHTGLIHLILPNARIIHTMRDPVDTCLSCFSRCFTHGQPFSYDLAELGRYYRGYYELMAHWRNVLPPGAMLDVSYEKLVEDFETQARRLLEYCGLPWDDRCLSFHETERPVRTASNVQVRRPLYSSSVTRWRRYELGLQPLLAELGTCREDT